MNFILLGEAGFELINLESVRSLSAGTTGSVWRIIIEFKTDVQSICIYYSNETKMRDDWQRILDTINADRGTASV